MKKKNNHNKFVFYFIYGIAMFAMVLFISLPFAKTTYAFPSTLNNNRVLENNDFSTDMSESDIQAFLNDKGSFFATYRDPSGHGTAAHVFWQLAHDNGISSRVLLVTAQKESSSISSYRHLDQISTAHGSMLDWFMFCGWPENNNVNIKWKGFYNQVLCASQTFGNVFKNSYAPLLQNGKRVGDSSVIDGISIIYGNAATLSLYNYTPHIQTSFFNIWTSYLSNKHFNGGSNTLPGKPNPSSPGNRSSLAQNTYVTLNWNTAANATQYKAEMWGTQYSLTTICNWQSGTSCNFGQMVPGTISWHVKARNSAGQESDWSDTWTFTIQQSAQLAGKPTLSSPGNGASMTQSTDLTLYWNTSSNTSQYKVEVWGGPYSLMTLCNWQSGTSCHIGQMLPGIISWHVKARNSAGQESDWSDSWSFTIQQSPQLPGKPSLSNPGNGASMAQNTDLTLYWNTSSNAVQYKVEVWGGQYSLMTSCNWQSGTSCHIGQMWPGTMYWHVKSRNSANQESDWSDTWSFTIQQAVVVWKPTLSSPGNGALLPKSTNVTLVWNSLSGAVQYKVEVWGGPYSLMTPCNWQSGTSCHIGNMWPGNMMWHVKARDTSGKESDWSDNWNFTITN